VTTVLFPPQTPPRTPWTPTTTYDDIPVNDPVPAPTRERPGIITLREDEVILPGGLRLALRRADGPRRPALLVHGLASNARVWDGVARRLAAGGHQVVAVDLRGHGRSAAPPAGYDTATAADDLAALITALGFVGERAPVVAGQSWGGNVVLDLAARHRGVAALALVDGGWIRLRHRFTDFEQCWAALAPPRLDTVPARDLERLLRGNMAGWPAEGVEGTLANLRLRRDGRYEARLGREHHRAIVRSMWEGDPRRLYPQVHIPVLVLPAVPRPGAAPTDHPSSTARAGAREALAGLVDAEVRWYIGAPHDLHAALPEAVTGDLLALLHRVEAGP
jgi:pimeloyl-ACP methyl ester carboxylesterase